MYPSNQGDWILGNVQQYGFYRVNYDTDNWRALMTQLKQQHTVYTVNQILFATTLFRNFPKINWFATTYFRDQAFFKITIIW